MGAWGSSLYANDITCDVRDTYTQYLMDQLSSEEAYQKLLDYYKECMDTDEEALVWFALADTQWRLGRLMPEVKAKALYWIENGGGMELWEESANGGKGWQNTLNKLKLRLETPMPKEKKIHRPEEYVTNPWNVGDVYAYQFHKKDSIEAGLYGKYILLQKIGDNGSESQLQVYDKVFDTLPILKDLDGLRVLPAESLKCSISFDYEKERNFKESPIGFNFRLNIYKKRHFEEKFYTFIGNQEDKLHMPINAFWREFYADSLETTIADIYSEWHGVDYKLKEGEGYYYVSMDYTLYSEDLARDVKHSYIQFLKDRFSNEEAHAKTLDKFNEYMGTDKEPLVWYALADTQWDVGRLKPDVKAKVLGLIEQSAGIELWSGQYAQNKWKRNLICLKRRIETPMFKQKVMYKEEFTSNPWEVGDVIAYRLHKKVSKEAGLKGKYMLLQKTGNDNCMCVVMSCLQVYDKVFDTLPTLQDLEGLRLIPIEETSSKEKGILNFDLLLLIFAKKDFDEKNFTLIGNTTNRKISNNYDTIQWEAASEFEKDIVEAYLKWHDKEY